MNLRLAVRPTFEKCCNNGLCMQCNSSTDICATFDIYVSVFESI